MYILGFLRIHPAMTLARIVEKGKCKGRICSRRNLFATRVMKCECCGTKEGKIYTHHLNSNPEDSSITNLLWVCPSCHKRFHITSFVDNLVTPSKSGYGEIQGLTA